MLASALSAFAQQSEKPLGDIAREQHQARKTSGAKVYTNDDLGVVSPAPAQDKASDSAPSAHTAVSPDENNARTASDRPQQPEAESITVPAGTQIKVDFFSQQVTAPVLIENKTVIPSSAKATLKTKRVYDQRLTLGYADFVELTSVTVGGRSYELHTNSTPLHAQHTAELSLILQESLSVTRIDSEPSGSELYRRTTREKPSASDDEDSSFIVLPKGTPIQVDWSAKKVVWPVRIGFDTPIPALSKVTLEDWGPIFEYGDYYKLLVLTSVTIGKATYPTKASAHIYSQNAAFEVNFYPDEELKIPRSAGN